MEEVECVACDGQGEVCNECMEPEGFCECDPIAGMVVCPECSGAGTVVEEEI